MYNSGRTSVGRNAKDLSTSSAFNAYSKVIINVTDELYYQAGDDTGRTLEIDMPWGTQAMANNLLSSLRGFQYQPYETKDALLDPAAELGDGITVNGVYSGIFRIQRGGGVLHAADVTAPSDEEINHEYKFVASSTRKIDRQIANVESELSVQANQISAKVSQTGGNASTFGWQLLATGFLLKSGNNTVFQCNSSGVQITGKVTATSGYIGNGSQGFLIGNKSISNGKSSLSDSNNGIYIGTDGIALGPNFKVDSSGNLTANSGTFTGSVYANMVQSGGDAGYITGGQIGSRAISVGKCSTGINASLGNADYSADVFSGAVVARYTKANVMMTTTFTFNQRAMKLNTRTVKDGSGNNVTIQYLGAY